MIDVQLVLRSGTATRRVALGEYLDASTEEAAHEGAHDWIKRLRSANVEGTTLRDRFTARGDSLWWFTELYLHKTQVVLQIQRAIAALNRLADEEGPAEITDVTGSPIGAQVTIGFASARGIRCSATVRPVTWLKRLAGLDARARALHLSALASRDRWTGTSSPSSARIAAFIHRAFWRSGESRGAAESYVGPILAELEARLGSDAVQYVGVGPAANFRVHRPLRTRAHPATTVVPIERFTSRAGLIDSRTVWRRRYADFRTLTQAADLRDASRILGVECWPIIREQLAGVAWLQWPWSARAMDESAAALEALTPEAVVTYAEAGGWGRALLLESRRRRIPSIGLQHGFIYRHWLNYRHEPDEMREAATAAFPLPTRTLVFDEYAARHLLDKGNFPPATLRVTGSPRLDALSAEITGVSREQVRQLRGELDIARDKTVALIATKEREARASLGAFLDAAARVRDVILVIKPHPAESADAYAGYALGRANVRIAKDGTSLALLLAAARAVITVNSTVALDGGALNIPALAIGLPNNLSPFVDAGAIAGSIDPGEIPALLERILYDESFRQHLADRRRTVFGEPGMEEPRRAASRSAEAIIELIGDGTAARPA